MDDADRLAAALGARRVGRQYQCCCPAHNDRSPSLTFWQGERAVRVKCWSGCEPTDVIRALEAQGVWPGCDLTPAERRRLRAQPRPPSKAALAAEAEAARKRAYALRLWEQAEPALDTLAERYLSWRRGLTLEALDAAERIRLLTEVIRYHPQCPCGPDRAPAMVSLMRGVRDDQPAGLHRVFLNPEARKIGRGMMLGPVGKAAVKLAPKGARLVVCEGVETALALLTRRGEKPVWALGSAGAIERLEPVFGVKLLIVRADTDPNGTGQRAAATAVTRWIMAGRAAQATRLHGMRRDYADPCTEDL